MKLDDLFEKVRREIIIQDGGIPARIINPSSPRTPFLRDKDLKLIGPSRGEGISR